MLFKMVIRLLLGAEGLRTWRGKLRAFGLFLAAVGALGSYSISDPVPLPVRGVETPPVPPDYQVVVLRDKGADRAWRTGDDSVWTMHFPKQMTVAPVQAQEWRKVTVLTHQDIKHAQRYGYAVPQSRYEPVEPVHEEADFQLLMGLPDFVPADGRFEDNMAGLLDVRMSPLRQRYHSSHDWGATAAFVSRLEKMTEFECAEDTEIMPGVQRYRDMTEDEARAAQAKFANRGPRFEFRRGCFSKAAVSGHGYVVRDLSGKAIGLGHCTRYTRDETAGVCRFDFWLPQERIITYRFAESFLPQVRDIHARVTTLLHEATVLPQTENIPGFEISG